MPGTNYCVRHLISKINFHLPLDSYLRAEIPSYDELGKLCYMTIGPEMARLGCECPEPGYCYTIEHGGYRKENIDIEYCEQVAAMGKDSDIIKFK